MGTLKNKIDIDELQKKIEQEDENLSEIPNKLM